MFLGTYSSIYITARYNGPNDFTALMPECNDAIGHAKRHGDQTLGWKESRRPWSDSSWLMASAGFLAISIRLRFAQIVGSYQQACVFYIINFRKKCVPGKALLSHSLSCQKQFRHADLTLMTFYIPPSRMLHNFPR